jgi:hypothetical protein
MLILNILININILAVYGSAITNLNIDNISVDSMSNSHLARNITYRADH